MPRKTWLRKLETKKGKSRKKKTASQIQIQKSSKSDLKGLKLEQIGRYSKISSLLDEKLQSNLKELLKVSREDLINEINLKIQKTLTLISEYDPLMLLNQVALNCIILNPENYQESITEQKEPILEYSLSLISGIQDISENKPSQEIGAQFISNVTEILELVN